MPLLLKPPDSEIDLGAFLVKFQRNMGTDLSGSLIGLILPLILSYINQESLNLIRQRLYKQKNIYSYFDFCNCCFESGLSYEEGEKLFEKFHNYGIIIKPTGLWDYY